MEALNLHGPPQAGPDAFAENLTAHGLGLVRAETVTLQINLGLLCNQRCRHCHLAAGPERAEVMTAETMDAVVAYAERAQFAAIDVTGGAPEMVPGLEGFLEHLAPLAQRLMIRSNLTALAEREHLLEVFTRLRVAVVASFPSIQRGQTDAQRGDGVFDTTLGMLRQLNRVGYGHQGTGLELDLVSNPTGAFLPPGQVQAEARIRQDLARKWGVAFNHLYTFANMPVGRFRAWLKSSSNLEGYLEKLAGAFNPCTVDGLMCRTLVSVDWEGYLHDCDFNLARGFALGGKRRHVSEMRGPPALGSPIATGDHCYACTAGAGFT